ncbi:DNA-directed RNA polymerase 2 subunit, putative [Babesia bigemina]|uniref:DNA-directed RNA polymerase 2 subunit, putative n=1 Tax=Babesia bigemina TaxID=5866 RepID=A0A061D4S1_BABBI|nr:DNA-directed RNA polymerase 2 subunit, putative [Babesia bigemina]CDR93949.1 DNA-directed RNA polymerase 2 subunit, putative [Babesia bigemina]|eukprot:XP_012766135.1 DNA-directed RNA polymerase 2 subunit, putative [Babesia bigemina]
MSKFFQLEERDVVVSSVYGAALYEIYTDRQTLPKLAKVAWYATLLSAFLLDGISILLTLLPFLDQGIFVALQRLGARVDISWAHYFSAQLLFTTVLYAVLPLALLCDRLFVWQSLQSWNLVGFALQLASVQYARCCCVFAFVARAAIGLCLRIAIADLTFKVPADEEPLDTIGGGKIALDCKRP